MTLRVAEAKTRDFGRGITRLDPKIVEDLGLHTGDVLQIENLEKNAKTAAILWPSYPEDKDSGIIRIDGSTRDNIKVALDEIVQVRKIKAAIAEFVDLAPIQSRLVVRNEQYFSQLLENRVITRGDIVSFMIMGSRIEFLVTSHRPVADAVMITLKTKIQVSHDPVSGDLKKKIRSQVSYADLGGIGGEIQMLRELIELPLHYPHIYAHIGATPPHGVLLYGPTGTGKSLLAQAVANETGAWSITTNGPEVISRYIGGSEENLRKIFNDAQEKAPAIIIIDDIDNIASDREELEFHNDRVVSQLIACLDAINVASRQITVIGTTSRIAAIDPSLRRPGRFEVEIELKLPSREGRREILQIQTRGLKLAIDVDLNLLAEQTEGFSGAHLAGLVRAAARHTVRRAFPGLDFERPDAGAIAEKMEVNQVDFAESFIQIKERMKKPEGSK